ncbi:MAG: SUMF1/EgtB/PvdO family nonheme iron enzyme [Spirochaetales bacterium]|nr:SUMF1/EgtB/PvdO family nonheme iron enzyme [Spirochaetales bacterium]
MAKEKEPLPDFSDVTVTLKPIFGIRPETYLPVVYAGILILLIFVILILPGLVSHGSLVTFSSVPSKAIVSVDGKYIGSTPITVFVKSGPREIEIRKPFYSTQTVKENIDGGVFGTLFFPLKTDLSFSLSVDDGAGLAAAAAIDFAGFGMLREFTLDYQLPPILTDAAEAVKTGDNEVTNDLEAMLFNALLFVDSESELHQALAGAAMIETGGKPMNQYSFITLIRKIIQRKEAHEYFPCWLSRCLSKRKFKPHPDSAYTSLFDQLTGSTWFTSNVASLAGRLNAFKESRGSSPGRAAISAGGIGFIAFSGGDYLAGNTERLASGFETDAGDIPHEAHANPFYISEAEITNAQFKRFIDERPEWAPSNRDILVREEKATEHYLEHWQGGSPSGRLEDIPVTHVSWYAAAAYCDWLSDKIGGSLRARLPLETEWEWCAKKSELTGTARDYFEENITATGPHSAGRRDSLGLRDLFGNVWEWCGDWFFPAGYFFTERDETVGAQPSDTLQGVEKVVRGGSWANTRKENIFSFTRGAQPPSWCTEFCGFRVVISER